MLIKKPRFFEEEEEEKKKKQKQNKTKQNKTKQNKTKQNKTKQNKTKQNKTKQNKTKQNKTKQNKTKQNKTKQNKTKQNKTKQNKTKQNKTKQNKTKQNKTKQNKTKKENACCMVEHILRCLHSYNQLFKKNIRQRCRQNQEYLLEKEKNKENKTKQNNKTNYTFQDPLYAKLQSAFPTFSLPFFFYGPALPGMTQPLKTKKANKKNSPFFPSPFLAKLVCLPERQQRLSIWQPY